jgi:hypothetical protein
MGRGAVKKSQGSSRAEGKLYTKLYQQIKRIKK